MFLEQARYIPTLAHLPDKNVLLSDIYLTTSFTFFKAVLQLYFLTKGGPPHAMQH